MESGKSQLFVLTAEQHPDEITASKLNCTSNVSPLHHLLFTLHFTLPGLIVPPFVVMKFSVAFTDVKLQQYAIAASLIISGLCTIMNCIQIPIPVGPCNCSVLDS